MRTPKANYKVFDRNLGQYIKRAKGKQTWASESWALSAGADHGYEQSYCDGASGNQYCINHLELHTFPIESVIVETWADRIEKNKAEAAINAEKNLAVAATKLERYEKAARETLIQALTDAGFETADLSIDELKAIKSVMMNYAKNNQQ